MNSGLYSCPGALATCMAAARAMRLALPSTRVLKVRRGSSRVGLRASVAAGLKGAGAGLASASLAGGVAAAGASWLRPTWILPRDALLGCGLGRCAVAGVRGAITSSIGVGCPASCSTTSIRRCRYWARIQSSLKRLPTANANPSAAGRGCSCKGCSQVANCCAGTSCAITSRQACHRAADESSDMDMGQAVLKAKRKRNPHRRNHA